MQTPYFRLDEHVFHFSGAYEQVVECALLIAVRGKVQPGGGVGLRVGVYNQDVLFQNGERGGKIDCRRGLSHSPFLIGYCNYFSHNFNFVPAFGQAHIVQIY